MSSLLHKLQARSKRELEEREISVKKLKMEVTTLREEIEILETQINTQGKLVREAKPNMSKLNEMRKK